MLSFPVRHLPICRYQLLLACALVLSACRDVKEDPGYCATCLADGGALAPEATAQSEAAASATPSTAAMSQAPASSAGGTLASVPPGGAGSSGSPRVTPPVAAASGSPAAAGRGVTAGVAQAGTGISGASSASAGNGGAAASSGTGGSTTSGGTGGTDAPPERDAGVDAGPMMTLPCGGMCSGNAPVCDEASRSCVECTPNDTQACAGDRAACDPETKRCVGCVGDENCQGALAACDIRTHKCVECVSDATCPGDKPVCDLQNQRCVTCLRNRPNSCRDGLPVCDEDAQMCVECTPREMNACRGTRKLCEPQRKICVECLSTNDCPTPEHPVCQQNQCMGCASQQDCGRFQNTSVCDQSRRVCVACVADSDCKGQNQRCNTAQHTCEQMPPPPPMPGTKQPCERCEMTNQCAGWENGGAICTQHGNAKHCFTAARGPCPGAFSVQSVSGQPSMYCLPRNPTSCEAIDAMGKPCDPSQAGQCGGGGECNDDRCTVRCQMNTDCPNGWSCMRGVCTN